VSAKHLCESSSLSPASIRRRTLVKAPCGKCDECTLINNDYVPSEIHKSLVLALGEAPGGNEAKDGYPFAGAAGSELDAIIKNCGGSRNTVSYINACSCRPTKIDVVNGTRTITNRTPDLKEIASCKDRLIKEIDDLSPFVIVTLGKIPYVALGGDPDAKMSDIVGQHFIWRNIYDVYVTYHPAAILHSGGAKSERGRVYAKAISDAFKKAFSVSAKPKQLTLF
jgi:uracil-DNA glycosylase